MMVLRIFPILFKHIVFNQNSLCGFDVYKLKFNGIAAGGNCLELVPLNKPENAKYEYHELQKRWESRRVLSLFSSSGV